MSVVASPRADPQGISVDLEDKHYYTQLLLEHSHALFIAENAEHETNVMLDSVWQEQCNDGGSPNTNRRTVTTKPALRALLERQSCSSGNTSTFVFIKQASSWSPLKISLSMFHMLLEHYNIFPVFVEVLWGFGLKTSEIDEQSPRCFYNFRRLDDVSSSISYCEIGYNLYHVEEHGRPALKDPWSVRQTAVYHKLCFAQQSSTWIFVQLAKPIRDVIDIHREGDGCVASNTPADRLHPVTLHILIFTRSHRNWKRYIGYLAERLSDLHEIACFSEVDQRLDQDYGLEFADCQKMELLLGRIRRILSIVQAQMQTLLDIKTYCKKLQQSSTGETTLTTTQSDHFELKIWECHKILQTYIHDLKSLLESAESTKSLLFKILDHRNDAVIHDNGSALRSLAQRSSFQSDLMLSMAEVTYYDSRTMRIISFIAMIYLPVSLVSSFFSTNIVQLATIGSTTPRVDLQKEVGFFVGSTILLTSLTVAGTFCWQQKERPKRLLRR